MNRQSKAKKGSNLKNYQELKTTSVSFSPGEVRRPVDGAVLCETKVVFQSKQVKKPNKLGHVGLF